MSLVVALCGSPRKNSNTKKSLEAVLEPLKKAGIGTMLVELSALNIQDCDGCRVCGPENKCVKKDDMQELYKTLAEADAIVLGSPTYFSSMSSLAKKFVDRSLYLRRAGMLLSGKLGGAVAVGASRNGGQEHVCTQIHNWMLLQEMLVVSDKKTAHFGGIVVANKAGEAVGDETGLQTCKNLGLRILEELGKKTR